MELPAIPLATTAMVFNDMINANICDESGQPKLPGLEPLIDTAVRWVADLRGLGVPIFWIRVERRADRKDQADVLTDAVLARGGARPPTIVKGTFGAQNIAQLPVAPEDQEILKPRLCPFTGTDLDLQLRARAITTILLAGISTHRGVESGARVASDLGYNVVVMSDLCWAADASQHDWALNRSLPGFARVMATDQARTLLR